MCKRCEHLKAVAQAASICKHDSAKSWNDCLLDRMVAVLGIANNVAGAEGNLDAFGRLLAALQAYGKSEMKTMLAFLHATETKDGKEVFHAKPE